jgi:serine O-acetyltransferase
VYPLLSREEIWNAVVRMVRRDSPFDIGEEINDYREQFNDVLQELLEEHSHIIGKYYRTKDKKPLINPLYVEHYARLLYYWSRRLFLTGVDRLMLDQLFFSIKTKCNIDLFYEIDIKGYFIPAHAFASVLGRAKYGKYLIVNQCCTVGNNHGIYPELGDRVILRPGATILGNCRIGNNVQIGANTTVIDRDVPDNTVVLGNFPDLKFRANEMDNYALYFE